MASVFKPDGAKKYVIVFTDENGKRRKKTGTTDKGVSERIARELENKVALRKEGLIDPKAEAYRDHEATPLARHIDAWQANLIAEGSTTKHVEVASNRVRRLVAVAMGSSVALRDHRRLPVEGRAGFAKAIADIIAPARLSSLTTEKIQGAIARLQSSGWSLQTCNHYRATIQAFARWCHDTHRTRETIRGLKGYNAKEDPRHSRRTISVEELRRLIDATERGGEYYGLSGPLRSLCYRTAAMTGLRFSELASIKPESFDWEAPSVTVVACYTKNGETATMHLPDDLALELAAFVATLQPGSLVFPLPKNKGSELMRHDLQAAGIPYQDASGSFFDFHSLRCETATLADAAGVSPRVVQRIMRHSSLELTGRYTKPRVVDIEAAADLMPNLKPRAHSPETLAMTGTHSTPPFRRGATEDDTVEEIYACNSLESTGLAVNSERSS